MVDESAAQATAEHDPPPDGLAPPVGAEPLAAPDHKKEIGDLSMATLDLALVETAIGPSHVENFNAAAAGVRSALDLGATLVVLPELCISGFGKKAIKAYLSDESCGPSALLRLAQECRARGADLVYGGPEPAEAQRYYNCLFLPSASPSTADVYRKFMVYTDVEVNFVSAVGRRIPNVVAFAHENHRRESFVVGVQLCADLRFPEVARASTEAGASIIVNASQWRASPRLEDGAEAYPEHWELLLRCRAIENQVFVAGCGATGTAREYHLHGHSMVADPLGRIIKPASLLKVPSKDERKDCMAKVLLYHLDMDEVGGRAHPQADPFLPWIASARADIEVATEHTRHLLACDLAGVIAGGPGRGAAKVLRALQRFRACCQYVSDAPQNERSVQELVWIMLRAQFDDVVREESLPTFAAKAYRPDFGIASLRTLVEIKYLNDKRDLSKLQDAILADVSGYLTASQTYDSLVVLVYDAAGGLLDAEKFCRDFERIRGVAGVVVVPAVRDLTGS